MLLAANNLSKLILLGLPTDYAHMYIHTMQQACLLQYACGTDWDVYGQDAAAAQTMGVTHCRYKHTNQRARFLSATSCASSQSSRKYSYAVT